MRNGNLYESQTVPDLLFSAVVYSEIRSLYREWKKIGLTFLLFYNASWQS